jgi:GT2 family glycosyltransferase
LDIIIPVHRRFDLLARCLDSIPEAAGDVAYNIVCIDNASPAEEAKFYDDRDDIFVIKNMTNLGFPKACNQGARRKTSPYIFFLNSDVILEPHSIEILLGDFVDPIIGVAGMMLKFPEYAEGLNQEIRPSGRVQHVGLETNIHGSWIHQFVGWHVDNPKVIARRSCYAVTGAALMTRRVLWNKIGGFDETYGLGTWEDTDYCMSIRELGYNIVVNVNAIGTHFTGATAEAYRIGYPMNDNKMKFMSKWQPKLLWSEWNCW